MSQLKLQTYIPRPDPSGRKWHLNDLKGAPLGRTAVKVADILRGKDKPIFTPHLDMGDNVVAINAKHVKVSVKKKEQYNYYWYSGYPGGLKITSLRDKLQKKPQDVFYEAVWGMLPKGRLGRKLIKKLHIYADAKHPHAAQKPASLNTKN
ncbi:MAG: 50S ribosomal protein L13 [Candidatus Zixiibacteriota bacterium]